MGFLGNRRALLAVALFFAAAALGLADDIGLQMDLDWPLAKGAGQILQGFGPAQKPGSGSWYIHNHVDIAALAGTPVLCPLPGVVTASGADPAGYAGVFVTIEHLDGVMRTTYMHLLTVEVDPGDVVAVGETLGTVGRTGDVLDHALGFQVYVSEDKAFADPLWFLSDSMPPLVRAWYEDRCR